MCILETGEVIVNAVNGPTLWYESLNEAVSNEPIYPRIRYSADASICIAETGKGDFSVATQNDMDTLPMDAGWIRWMNRSRIRKFNS